MVKYKLLSELKMGLSWILNNGGWLFFMKNWLVKKDNSTHTSWPTCASLCSNFFKWVWRPLISNCYWLIHASAEFFDLVCGMCLSQRLSVNVMSKHSNTASGFWNQSSIIMFYYFIVVYYNDSSPQPSLFCSSPVMLVVNCNLSHVYLGHLWLDVFNESERLKVIH